MSKNFTYLFDGLSYSDTSREYMNNLGLNTEQIESVLEQMEFELSQNVKKRQAAYRAESDPLNMEWQYDKTTAKEQAWRDKVAAIKRRYPLLTET